MSATWPSAAYHRQMLIGLDEVGQQQANSPEKALLASRVPSVAPSRAQSPAAGEEGADNNLNWLAQFDTLPDYVSFALGSQFVVI